MRSEQEPQVRATKTPGGWKIELDNAAWMHLMWALTIAIDNEIREGKQPKAEVLRKLRTALHRAEHVEG